MEQALLINPNIGHPLFLNIDRRLKRKEFEIDFLVVSNISEPKTLEKLLRHKIELVPILEYKWKLKKIMEQERIKRIKEVQREEKKSFWIRLKERLFHRDRPDKSDVSRKTYEIVDSQGEIFDIIEKKKIEKLKPRVFRGDSIQVIIIHVEKAPLISIESPEYESYSCPQSYLLKHNIFDGLSFFHKVRISFSITNEILEFLKDYTFVMFDIIHDNIQEKRINYHSLVLSKNKWKNFQFIHATDLHLAKRNDDIYGIVKNWTSIFKQEKLAEVAKQSVKTLSFFERIFKKKESSKPIIIKPLVRRIINPNNNFRKFIRQMNTRVLKNELDFIVLTGDIVDFTIFSEIPKDVRKTLNFEYENSNWKVFKEIILNLPQTKKRGMLKGQELICPVFTIPGNHDFRPFHYDLRWGGLYRKLGLNANEALALNDKFLANPISSITKSFNALKGYLTEINSSLDYSIRLGKHLLVFLNSGSDSFKNIRDFLMGHPSVTGLSSRQIKYLENIINFKKNSRDQLYLFLHAPPINPRKTISFFKKLSKKDIFEEFLDKVDEFKETVLRSLGKKSSAARIDGKFDVKFGTVSSNWEKLIEFCKDHCILTLSGHTHELKEFRLEDPRGEKSKVYTAPPFSLKKLENPAAVYFDLYSELYTNAKLISLYAPFLLQTPALGLGGYNNPKLAGGYREIKIRKNRLTSFKVYFIKS